MRERVQQLTCVLADDHGRVLPPRIARAELGCYLRLCASVLGIGRLAARRYVTDDLLRALAQDIADDVACTQG